MRDVLILQLGRLGDLVQTLPLLRRLKEEDPPWRVTLVCLEESRGILGESGAWDRLVCLSLADSDALGRPENREAFPNLPPFDRFPELRQAYHLLVNLTFDHGSSVICEKLAADRKLGRVHTPHAGELRMLGPWPKYVFAMVSHRLENLFNLVDLHAGMAGLVPKPQPPSLGVPPGRAEEARGALRAAGWRGNRPLVALQTGASDLQRAWDLESFAGLACRLLDDGAEVVLLGDSKEGGRAEALRQRLRRPVIDLVGKTSLGLLPAVVKAVDLLISNDTGTIHVAAAVGTPTLGLFFSTAYFSETAPYGDGHAVLQVEIPCAPCNASTRCPVQVCREYLTVPDVHAAARWLLRPGSPPPPARPHVSLYRSRFLENGTLLYAPVRPENASGHFLTGLLGRLVWEAALELPGDAMLEASWRQASSGEAWRRQREVLAGSLASLSEPVHRGLELAARLSRAFASGETRLVPALHGQLASLGASLAAAASRGGLLGDYLHFELMDMDYVGYPDLAGHLERKYRALSAWVDRAQGALQRM